MRTLPAISRNKMFILLLAVTVAVVAGMALEPSGSEPSIARYIIGDVGMFLVTLLAALIGLQSLRIFTLGSALGKSILFVSAGLVSWGIGSLWWLYYHIILGIGVPYPSPADAALLATPVLMAVGMFMLLRSIQVKFDWKTILKVVIIPFAMFILVYVLFVQGKLAEDVGAVEKVLNVAYPLGDAVILSFALFTMTAVVGGKMFRPVAVLCAGFVIEALADFSFSWTTASGTYYLGSFTDMLFTLAFFTIGIGMYLLQNLYVPVQAGATPKDLT